MSVLKRVKVGVLFIAGGWALWGQTIEGRYLVELAGEPAAAVLARVESKSRIGAASRRRAEIALEQAAVRRTVISRGGRVLAALDTVMNALVVEATPEQAARIRTLAGVLSVRPDRMVWARLNSALTLAKAPEAFTRIGGTDKAGAGMKVAILDSGIDASHPGFKDDSLVLPDGFPIVSSDANRAYVNNKVVVARSYEALQGERYGAGAEDGNGHGTNAACAAACVVHTTPAGQISGFAPKAFLGNYKVLGNNGGGSNAAILKGIDDAVKDGMDVLNLSLGSDIAGDPAKDEQAQALERAVAAGYIVVAAAGNAGPDENTINSPGSAPNVISVGSSSSGRSLDLDGNTGPIDPNRLSDFSSRGPSLSTAIKPDMVAVGDNFYTASSTRKNPDQFYTMTQGTSFASPSVAGAAAALKAARPGLTAAQYRSLLINSSRIIQLADTTTAPVRHQGAGALDLDAALRASTAVQPTGLNFGIGGDSLDAKQEFAVTNLSTRRARYTVQVVAHDGKRVAVLSGAAEFELDSGASQTLALAIQSGSLSGEYQGSVVIQSDQSDVTAHVPYWYGVRSGTARAITLLEAVSSGAAGETVTMGVRALDGSGIAVDGVKIEVQVVRGGGSVVEVGALPDVPGTSGMILRLGAGENVFVIKGGDASREITITGQ